MLASRAQASENTKICFALSLLPDVLQLKLELSALLGKV